MMSVLLVLVLFVVATLWVRGTRSNRQHWLEQLDLPGVWTSDDSGPGITLEFQGEFDHGRYHETFDGGQRQGQWRLQGHILELQAEGTHTAATGQVESASGLRQCDLILFDIGRIGLHGNGFDHRVFNKTAQPAQKTSRAASDSNVVPLRRTCDH